MIDGKDWSEFRRIASMVLSLTILSAALERFFSTTGFIHWMLTNYLEPMSVNKLTFIRRNLLALYDYAGHNGSEVTDDSASEDSK